MQNRLVLFAAVLGLTATPAAAQVFDIEDAETASQAVEMELLNTFNVEPVAGNNRTSHQIGVNYGALSYWRTGLAFQLSNPRGQTMELTSIEWSNTFALYGGETSFEPSAFALALYTALTVNAKDGEDVTLTVGPAAKIDFGETEVAANTFFEVPIDNSGRDVALDYALGMKYAFSNALAVGVEAHGAVPSVFDNAPSIDQQEHYAGPTIEYTISPEGEGDLGLQLGAFYGFTDMTPTVGIAANLEFGF